VVDVVIVRVLKESDMGVVVAGEFALGCMGKIIRINDCFIIF
jgi:hypothetical protein